MSKPPARLQKGRGAVGNPLNRFHQRHSHTVDDGWGSLDAPEAPLKTEQFADHAKSVITYNDSPDVPFDRSINPYRGCEHGCSYCFARPSHAYLDLSPGLDFEQKLFFKPDAAALLRKELSARNYQCAPIALGVNTDAYQPIERDHQITRQILEVLVETRHPVSIITKSALIERDLDLLESLATDGLVSVIVSVTTLDKTLARKMEPRAAAPHRRLETIRALSASGIPVGVLLAPVIPFLNDEEMETILQQTTTAGAGSASMVFLRLPREVKTIFEDWLEAHYPLKARRIMQRVYDSRGGKAYSAEFGTRMSGAGVFAELLQQRFKRESKKLNLGNHPDLRTSLFRPPNKDERQLDLF